jgi:hypothetical protein
MNWGYKIMVVYIVFVAGILFMVYKCTQQNIDLVSANYYDQEIKYSEQYNREANSKAPEYKLKVNYNSILKTLDIHYPQQLAASSIQGEVSFFKPDNAKFDFKVAVEPGAGNIQQIPLEKLNRGTWRVRTSWSANGLPLYHEEKINLQ